MENKPYYFYASANSYNYESVAHDYEVPVVHERKRKSNKEKHNEQLRKAVARRLIAYVLAAFVGFSGILCASVLYKGETDALAKNTKQLQRLENDNVRYQSELSRKMAPETIRQIATEELGMSYVDYDPIYIRVMQGEQIVVYK